MRHYNLREVEEGKLYIVGYCEGPEVEKMNFRLDADNHYTDHVNDNMELRFRVYDYNPETFTGRIVEEPLTISKKKPKEDEHNNISSEIHKQYTLNDEIALLKDAVKNLMKGDTPSAEFADMENYRNKVKDKYKKIQFSIDYLERK